MDIQKIFPVAVPNPGTEAIETLLKRDHVSIEKIVSHSYASPEGFWYDQKTDEWVMVLEGRAFLLVDGERDPVDLQAGEAIFIPAHQKHRVESTSEHTVWLAVHLTR